MNSVRPLIPLNFAFLRSLKAMHLKVLSLLLCIFLSFFNLPMTAIAQSNGELSKLIFEPTPIYAEEFNDIVSYVELEQATSPSTIPQPLLLTQASFPAPSPQNTEEFKASLERYQNLTNTLELQGGPYNETLGQVSLSIGTLYQQQGQQAEAIEAFDKALHLNRLNNGLFNMTQLPIIKKVIESHFFNGDLENANDKQDYLLYLHQKEYGTDSIEVIPALLNYANWNIMAFNTPLNTSTVSPNQTIQSSNKMETSGSDFQKFMYGRLINAQQSYRSLGTILYENYGTSDPQVFEVERRIALTNYLFASNFFASYTTLDGIVVVENTMGYRFGKEALQRQISYLEETPEPASANALARAWQELGDWYLLFQRRSSAMESYRKAHQAFIDPNSLDKIIPEFLRPAIPDPIPTFLTEQYTKEAYGVSQELDLDTKGYIDVEFTVSGFGNTGPIKVLGESEGTSPLIKAMLISKLKPAQYRPRLTDEGKVIKKDRYSLRYYYSY